MMDARVEEGAAKRRRLLPSAGGHETNHIAKSRTKPTPPSPPQATGAQYFSMDDEEIAPAAVRLALVEDVQPLEWHGRR